MKHYLIYQIRNKLNNKIYIGKHITKNINDSYMGSGTYLQNAINKYGIENFEKTILFECASEEEMNAKEAEIVNEQFLARDDVYNINKGGNGGWFYVNKTGKNVSEKSILAAKKHLLKGLRKYIEQRKTNSEIDKYYRQRLSEGLKLRYQSTIHPSLGTHLSESAKHKIHLAHTRLNYQKGEKNSQYGKISIYNTITFEQKKINKNDQIPDGWERGHFYKATPEELQKRKWLVEQIKKLNPKSSVTIRVKLDKLQELYKKLLAKYEISV